MKYSTLSLILALALVWWQPAALADTALTPFLASYEASFGGFKASADRSLVARETERRGGGEYVYESSVRLKLLGRTITRIRERSIFDWQGTELVPEYYEYQQTGFGSRSRSVTFDWEGQSAEAVVDEKSASLDLDLDIQVFDELSAYIELKRQLLAGEENISLMAVDGTSIQREHYRVVSREPVNTALGPFNAVRLEKVRDADSDRKTEIWLASDWDYLLLKLFQREPGGREIEMTVAEAVMGGEPVLPLAEWPEK